MPETVANRSPSRVWLLAAVLIAAVVRGVCLVQTLTSPLAGLYRADHGFYREWGLQIAAGQWSPGHVFEQGPLYAYLVGLFYAVCGRHDAGLLAVQLATGLISVWLVYRIGQQVFDEWTARIAAVVTALYGPLIYFEALLMKAWLTPVLCTLLAYGLLQVAAAGATRSWRKTSWLLGSAAVVGALCLIRENYVLLLPVVVAVGVAGAVTWRARLCAGLLPVAVFAVCTLPATMHNYRVSGDRVWVTSGGGEVLYMAWAPDATGYYRPPDFIRPDPVFEHEDFRLEASRRLGRPVSYRESSAFWTKQACVSIGQAPLHALSLAGRKLLIAINDFEVPDSDYFEVAREQIGILQWLPTFGWIGGWGLIGLCLPGFRQRNRLILLSIVGVHLLSIVLTYNFARFRLGMMPVWILFASAAIVFLIRGVMAPRGHLQQLLSIGGLVVGGLLCLAMFLPPPKFAEAGYPEMADGYRQFLKAREKLLRKASEMSAREPSLSTAERYELAETWFAAREFDAAEAEFQRILQKTPNDTDARMHLAVLQGQQGRYAAAEALLLQALETDPGNVDLWANLGNARFHRALRGTLPVQQRREWLELARQAYARGLKLDPHNSTCRAGLSSVRRSSP